MKKNENHTTGFRRVCGQSLVKAKLLLAFLLLNGTYLSAALPLQPMTGAEIHPEAPQTKKITGRVVDEQGMALPGVTVLIKGTTNGMATNIDGHFELMLNDAPNAVLVISFIGMQTIEQKVGNQSDFKFVMKDANVGLEEVIVVGYGTQKKATVTGSISSIGGEELKKNAAIDITNTLAGKTAGVIANTRSGEPGEDAATLLIRGKSTFNNNSPLVVIDGVADRGSFGRLNPEDIESISILKDASAAIYGARAANGVILVTTKRGKAGKTQVTYSGNVGFTQPTRIPDMLDSWQYATWLNEYADRHGKTLNYTPDQIQKYKEGSDLVNYPNTNWWEETTNNWATKTQHSLSVNGGNEKVTYYVSAQYLYQDAIYKKSAYNYNQYQFVSNLDAKLSDDINLSVDILGRQEIKNRGRYDTDYIFTRFLQNSPMTAPYYPNGLPRAGIDGAQNNVALMVTDIPGKNKKKYTVLNLKPRLKWDMGKILNGLYVEGWAAIDLYYNDEKSFNQPFDVYLYNTTTKEYDNKRSETGTINLYQAKRNSQAITFNARLGYSRTFKEIHKLEAFVAYEQYKYNNSEISAGRNNFISTQIDELFAGSSNPDDRSNSGYSGEAARQNIFGRINYNYDNKYLLEGTLRYDGSQNFAKEERWGIFPAFAAGWIISEEDFFRNSIGFINHLKIKASWGMMGNDNISAFQYLSEYSFTAKDESNNDISAGATFGKDNVFNNGLIEKRIANPLVTWEAAQTTNVGFSAQFLDGKFGLDFDYFYSKRKNILMSRGASVPAYAGLTLPAENIGKVDNFGTEVVATYKQAFGEFNLSVNGNFTFARSKVKYMDEAATTPSYQKTEGHSIDGYLIYQSLGIYQTQEEVDNSVHIEGAKPGDIIYADKDEDGSITSKDMFRMNETLTPEIMYGLTVAGSWRGLDLMVFFQGQAKAKQIVMPTSTNLPKEFFDGRWVEGRSAAENASAKYPRAFVENAYPDDFNGKWSTFWMKDGGFLRLKSVELGYSLPKSVLKAIHLQNVRVYANGNNLFSVDKIKVCDPEMPENKGGIAFYPQQRMITMGLNVTF